MRRRGSFTRNVMPRGVIYGVIEGVITVSRYHGRISKVPAPTPPVPNFRYRADTLPYQNSASVNSPFRRELLIGVLRRPPPPFSAARCTPPWSLHARHRTDPHCSFAPIFAATDH